MSEVIETPVEYYQQLVNWLTAYPHFTSKEEALNAIQLSEGYTFFILDVRGGYEVHRAFIHKGTLASQADFVISYTQLGIAKDHAIRHLGEQALQVAVPSTF